MVHEHNGFTIKIERDEMPESPREWCNLSTFAFFHRNYKNESDISSDDFSSAKEIQEYIENTLNAICVPVYLYSHSGDAISTTPFNCQWDSGQLGFAFVTRDKVRKEYGFKRISPRRKGEIENYLKGEVDTFNQYVNGEIYGYTIEKNGEVEDSCWGFYGKDYCLTEAKNIISSLEKEVA